MTEVIVDALPYIDTGYDDVGVRESALAMVEEECRRYRPTKNYLDHLPSLNTTSFETQLLNTEFERIQNHQPMETLSMKRYELPPPPAGKLSEISAWQESIENSMAQLEHQLVRAMNLELMLDYGIEMWKSYLEIFASLQAKAQELLQTVKKKIQDVNWQRKQSQTQAGEKLKNLEATWVMLVSKNYEIEEKCVELEEQVHEAKMHLQYLQENSQQNQPNGRNQSDGDDDDDDEDNNDDDGDDNDDDDDDNEDEDDNTNGRKSQQNGHIGNEDIF